MPTKDEHKGQAEHNRAFWESYNLDSTPYLDWVVIGLFYESVHWIEAYLDTKGEHSGGHPDRLRHIRRYGADIGTIRNDYEVLKIESENARYLCYKHNSTEISGDLIPVLDNIKSTIEKVLV
ncbi:hypothetical protein ES703_87568 [subsurface metagenome]